MGLEKREGYGRSSLNYGMEAIVRSWVGDIIVGEWIIKVSMETLQMRNYREIIPS